MTYLIVHLKNLLQMLLYTIMPAAFFGSLVYLKTSSAKTFCNLSRD